jgi:hypothetical protein
MRGAMRVGVLFWIAAWVLPGCAATSDARYVYQDGQFGVVAIPRNTADDPNHYRAQAESLMAQHFPQGYEIVRAEEVVEGSRTLTVGKAGSTELTPQVAPHLLALLKVGASITKSQADTMSLRECRIIYKKADAQPGPAAGKFAPEPALSPTCYHDPNTESKTPEKGAVKPPAPRKDAEPAPGRPSERLVGE